MKNNLRDWLIDNRDKEGLTELFFAFDEKIKEHRTVMTNKVRDDEDAKIECGAADALEAFKKSLLAPLQTDSGLET